MLKKIILASVLALAFSGTANAKQIMYCYGSPSGEAVTCRIPQPNSGMYKETNLKSLYNKGWRIVSVIPTEWTISDIRHGIMEATFYLEK